MLVASAPLAASPLSAPQIIDFLSSPPVGAVNALATPATGHFRQQTGLHLGRQQAVPQRRGTVAIEMPKEMPS